MSWGELAACINHDPELFFPEHGIRMNSPALKICAGCPVLAECSDYAKKIKPSDGIWAGKNYTQRRSRRRLEDDNDRYPANR